MSVLFTDPKDVPERNELFKIDGEAAHLRPALEIKPPEDSAQTPPILSFKRKREIEIPWGEIFKDIGVEGGASTAALRAYFEDSWGVDLREAAKGGKDALATALLGGDKPNVMRLSGPEKDEPATVAYQPNFDKTDDAGNPTPEPLHQGFVFRHGSSGRVYLVLESGLTPGHFKTAEGYEAAWRDHIEGVELVFEDPGDVRYSTDFEEIDLRPAIIRRRFEELNILERFATRVKTNVNTITEKMIAKIVETTLDPDELEDLQRRSLRLEMGEYDAKRRKERLAHQASSLGYRLPLVKEKVPIPGKADKELQPGELYVPYRRTARWTTRYTTTRRVRSGWWIFAKTRTKKTTRKVYREKLITDYAKVDTSKDLLSDKRKELLEDDMETYVFEQRPEGFITADGTPLSLIMDRCGFDEDFRRRCVVLLPVYEDSMLGDRLVSKYSIFKRPLPGILPTILPRLSIEESLSYRTAWKETRLGELVSSINLAPGEERTVTMTKVFEQETAVTRSSTSIFDITRSETTDLASEMENMTRQEGEQTSNLQFSAKASASYGFASAEASASGGTTHSLKDVSQAIGKVAKKAAKSVSQQNREEVTSTSTSRTRITNTDETTATITNINQGRSLNLMFYRLSNKFTGGLFLEGLQFDVLSGVELIAGSGVLGSKSYSLEDLPGMMAEFRGARLPFDIAPEQQDDYENRVLDAIESLIGREYLEPPAAPAPRGRAAAAAVQPAAAATSVQMVRLAAPAARAVATLGAEGAKAPRKRKAADRLAELTEALRGAEFLSDTPMVSQELLIAAPGFYLDSVVGVRASTEPYSEEMRAQEVRLRAAEVFLKESEGIYQRAQAKHLLQANGGDDGNFLTDVVPDYRRKNLQLALKQPLPPGNWYLRFDGRPKGQVPKRAIGKDKVSQTWPSLQEWLKAEDLTSRIELFDQRSGISITYPR
jgi:hypothetical protein